MSVTLVHKRANGVVVGQHVMDLVPVEGQHGHGKLHLPTIRRTFGLNIVELDGSVSVEIDGVTLRTYKFGTRVEVTGTPMSTGTCGLVVVGQGSAVGMRAQAMRVLLPKFGE